MIVVNVLDERTAGAPLAVDAVAVALIAERVGVPTEIVTGDTVLNVVLSTKQDSDPKAGEVRLNEAAIEIVVNVLAKETYSEKALYQINKVLVRQLRYVAQVAIALKPSEEDANTFGRLAHHAEYCAISAGVRRDGPCHVTWEHVCSECGAVGEPVAFTDDDWDHAEPVYIHNHADCKGEVTLSAYSLTE